MIIKFQSTLPRGSDFSDNFSTGTAADFNPRSLAGATMLQAKQCLPNFNFNPRSLAGATITRANRINSPLQFQSTLPRGSDSLLSGRCCCAANFNPRSLAGATYHSSTSAVSKAAISIHAPSRERLPLSYLIKLPSAFQSTLPRGSDTALCERRKEKIIFQSTLPRGSDSLLSGRCCCAANFNPRSLAGATFADATATCIRLISIHAPSRERRRGYPSFFQGAHFNPRSLAGATLLLCDVGRNVIISIHAPSRERPVRTSSQPCWSNFNPRSLAGATVIRNQLTTDNQGFQSTLPRGSDRCYYRT